MNAPCLPPTGYRTHRWTQPWLRPACFVPLLIRLLSTPSEAATVTLFNDTMDSYAVAASSLADTSDADPSTTTIKPSDDDPVGGVLGSGIQVINWLSHSAPNALLVRQGTTVQFNLSPIGGSQYTFDFWMYSVKTGAADRGFRISLRTQGADVNEDSTDFFVFRSVQSSANNAAGIDIPEYYAGVAPFNAWTPIAEKPVTNAVWQHYRVVADNVTRTFHYFVDDMTVPVLTDAPAARAEQTVVTAIRLIHEGNSSDDGYFVVDDVSLTVEGTFSNLNTTLTEGFEGYPARVAPADDADPLGAWVVTETDGTGGNRNIVTDKVQVVASSEITPHSGTKCLKIEGGQRAGATIAWGHPPQSDVQITWWSRVPAAIANNPTPDAVYLRVSIYGTENGFSSAGDSALFGYGIRATTPVVGDATALLYFTTAWADSGADYTPDTWEEYRLTTSVNQNNYTVVKNPSSANPQVVVDRAPFIGTTPVGPIYMVAWSSSNGSGHPPVYVDDIEVKSLVNNSTPLPQPYVATIPGSRFTNVTVLNVPAKRVGGVTVDPRDNASILFTDDSASGGSILRARKVASGNWTLDAAPILSGLDNPSGVAIQPNGTLWWTHDFTMSLRRLQAPWDTHSVEEIISNFGSEPADDDPIDLAFAPTTFNGALGAPGSLIVVDRGSDNDSNNALYVVDPATTALGQGSYVNFLAGPDTFSLGSHNANAIAPLTPSGEIVVLNQDGSITAVNGDGALRYITPTSLYSTPDPIFPTAVAVDPTTSRIWIADDILDEIWSVDSTTGVPSADMRELAFPLTRTDRPDLQIDFNEPGMAFAANGAFLVVSDTSTANGGGRLLIFHNEPFAVAPFSITNIVRTGSTVQLGWENGGAVKYKVQRGATPTTMTDYSGDLTVRQYTDTNAVAGQLFYQVQAMRLPN